MTANQPSIPLPLFRRGKVRDVYEFEQQLLIVSSDRISAFDYVLPSIIPGKGIVLNQLSLFWFQKLENEITHHLIDPRPEARPEFAAFAPAIAGRSMLVKKVKALPVEAIIRGYLVGSGWQSYQRDGRVCGLQLPPGLDFAARFSEPLFTPTTKAEQGHDADISFSELETVIGSEKAVQVRDLSLKVYQKVAACSAEKGIILADSKFEFGLDETGRIILIDEICTPDSSRFWKASDYSPGIEPPSYDKQFVRNYLLNCGWDRNSPPPILPEEVVERTGELYREIYQILTGRQI